MFISSDTNVWFDFTIVGQVDYPFLLDNSYYLSSITYHDEIDENNFFGNTSNSESFKEIRKCIKENKLLITDVTSNELKLAMRYESEYKPPKINKAISIQDSIALAIAKERNWILLSGDSGLREAAKHEGVICHGTLWIYDELLQKKLLSKDEYLSAMNKILDTVDNKKRRLPRNEIEKRIESMNNKYRVK